MALFNGICGTLSSAQSLRIVTSPEVDAEPSPDDTITAPPMSTTARPRDACSDPSAPLVPPTDTHTSSSFKTPSTLFLLPLKIMIFRSSVVFQL
jgi:hypothetical protein